jgi:hypothetical protein
MYVVRLFLGILLALATLALVIALVVEGLQQPVVQKGLIGLGILIGLLWFLWGQLPEWFRDVIHRAIKHKEHGNGR